MTEIDRRLADLARMEREVEEIHIMRGLTRGIVMVALRQKRKKVGLSLRDMAAKLDCSAPMLHDLETGRRWSTDIVERYAGYFLLLEGMVRVGVDAAKTIDRCRMTGGDVPPTVEQIDAQNVDNVCLHSHLRV